MRELLILIENVRDMFLSFGNNTEAAAGFLHMFTVPLNAVVNLMKFLGPRFIQIILLYKLFNKVLPISAVNMFKMVTARLNDVKAQRMQLQELYKSMDGRKKEAKALKGYIEDQESMTKAVMKQVAVQVMLQASMFLIVYLVQKWGKNSKAAAFGIGALVGMVTALAVALTMANAAKASFWDPSTWVPGVGGYKALGYTLAAGAAVGGAIGLISQTAMKPPDVEMNYDQSMPPEFATGGRVMFPRTRSYATGGRARQPGHFPVMVEAGETIISKTQNMANGGASGVTIQIHGDVYDGDNFAHKVGQALPNALRSAQDRGRF